MFTLFIPPTIIDYKFSATWLYYRQKELILSKNKPFTFHRKDLAVTYKDNCPNVHSGLVSQDKVEITIKNLCYK